MGAIDNGRVRNASSLARSPLFIQFIIFRYSLTITPHRVFVYFLRVDGLGLRNLKGVCVRFVEAVVGADRAVVLMAVVGRMWAASFGILCEPQRCARAALCFSFALFIIDRLTCS